MNEEEEGPVNINLNTGVAILCGLMAVFTSSCTGTVSPISTSSAVTYSRSEFPHWSDLKPPWGCNTRSEILERDVNEPGEAALSRDSRGCVRAANILDPYTGKFVSGDNEIEIDHVVSLHDAWVSGAATWTRDERERFANDPANLVATSVTTNRSKGDRGPDAWQPPNRDDRCAYARTYLNVKSIWELVLTEAQKKGSDLLLAGCPR